MDWYFTSFYSDVTLTENKLLKALRHNTFILEEEPRLLAVVPLFC